MRNATLRKERTTFLNELDYIMTNVGDDKNYFKRLLWANEWISHRLTEFENNVVLEEEENERGAD